MTKDIDVVTYLELQNGKSMVLEVKLNFDRSKALLESQYASIEIGAIIMSVILLLCILITLLIIITRTALNPVLLVNEAMENVQKGNLDIKLEKKSNDGFGMLSESFNEMVKGLKEKFKLYKYSEYNFISTS
ncbi:MAG: HAMP domain-containing protein [Spirochaetaceae bacterium]|nr:HAMP domain-containing protein [Spirochaetaceae bacterium]